MGSKTSHQGNVFSSSMDSNAPPSAYFDGDSISGASSDEDRPLNMNTPSGVLPDYKPPRDSVPFHTHDIRPLPPVTHQTRAPSVIRSSGPESSTAVPRRRAKSMAVSLRASRLAGSGLSTP